MALSSQDLFDIRGIVKAEVAEGTMHLATQKSLVGVQKGVDELREFMEQGFEITHQKIDQVEEQGVGMERKFDLILADHTIRITKLEG
jgi:hypothetical protein